MFLNSILIAVVGAGVLCAAVPSSYVVHEERHEHLLKGWSKRDRVDQNSIIPVRIGLKQRNVERGEDLLYDVSDPKSENYLKHWSAEQVLDHFRPSEETFNAVKTWLVNSGVSANRIDQSLNKGWLAFDATARELEGLLFTEYHEYEHLGRNHAGIACNHYHVPKAIQEHVDMISPGIAIYHPYERHELHAKRSVKISPHRPVRPVAPDVHIDPTGTANCSHAVTPACIRALYDIPLDPKRSVPANNSIGVFETEFSYAQSDLDKFFSTYSPFIPKGSHPKLDSIHNAKAPSPPKKVNTEADLDFQLVYPIVYPQKIVLYQANPVDSIFKSFVEAVDGAFCTSNKNSSSEECGIYKPTNTITFSYGLQETDFPAAYQKRQCAAFMKLGLQGSSLFFASGDSGVAGRSIGPDPGCLGSDDQIFNPTYPATCYAITTVGATRILPGNSPADPESAAYQPKYNFYSSGGFSNLFPAPKYQKAAIETYFKEAGSQYPSYAEFGIKNFDHRKGLYNRLGRAYPDVSANGQNTAVIVESTPGLSGGTSAAAPTFASIITLINDERIAAGKPPLGFLNPILYQNPDALNDIVNGTNPGCGTVGFNTAKGWDPVTGLGTPNYPKLRKLLLNV